MNNTYRMFFKVLRAWWIGFFLLAFIPMSLAQPTITNVAVDPSQYPGEDITVTLSVTGFDDANTYMYYVVYDYQQYGKLLEFTNDPDPVAGDVDITGLVGGDGDIVITSTVPVELYKYGLGSLNVMVVDAGGDLVYQLNAPPAFESQYPPTGDYNAGDMSFAGYNNQIRVFESPQFYEFDAGTNFSFTITRLNPEPAVRNTVLVQFRVGNGSWQTIRTIDLNTAGAGQFQQFLSTDGDWNTLIEDGEITVRIIQSNGDLLSSGIDTWAVTDFYFTSVIGETPTDPEYTEVFDYFWVYDLVDYSATANNFTILSPSFDITAFNTAAVDLFPGAQVTYEITGGASMSFPAATRFEVSLYNDDDGEEILLGNLPLTGPTGMPGDGVAKSDFTVNLPFRPKDNWYLRVRGELLDQVVEDFIGPFTIEDINLNAYLDLASTPTAQKLVLDGVTYLFPGSEIHLTYDLDGIQTIETSNKDVAVVLEYYDGTNWVELNREDFTMTAVDQEISGVLPGVGLISADDIDLRLKLVDGTKIDYESTNILRPDGLLFNVGSNANWLPVEFDYTGSTFNAGSKISFHVFARNNTAQGIIVEYLYDGQETWKQLGTTINTILTDNKYVAHYAVTSYNIVPTGELSISNPRFRIRWSNGYPLGTNKGILRGFRVQEPLELAVISDNTVNVNMFYPYLTLSDNVSQLYEFEDAEGSISFTVDYSRYAMPSTTQIAVVLLENGDNPMVDPYLYLGSKAAGTSNGEDTQTFTIDYADMEAVFGPLPQLPDVPMDFDVWIIATTKALADPIMFKTEQINVGWKFEDQEQPMMITEAIDLTGLPEPIYLNYDWVVTVAPDPLNEFTLPIMEYTTDEGITWTKIDEHPFNTMLEIDEDWISTQTRFRWTQAIELGDWDVQNVKILSGEDNLVDFEYDMTNIPQLAQFALAAAVVPPVVDPCEDFDDATLSGYQFSTTVSPAYAGVPFDFDWSFLRNEAKAISDSSVSAYDKYVHGVNEIGFNLSFDTDKRITQFTMTFPAGIVPTAADIIMVDGNTLTPVITAATRLITWATPVGVLIDNNSIDFNVTLNIATTVNDTVNVAWTLVDADGTVNGTAELFPALSFPEGTVFTFWIWDGGYQEIAGDIVMGAKETFSATIPDGTFTGAYDVYVTADYSYWDEGTQAYVPCATFGPAMVYEDLFTVMEYTPEVYEIEITDVNYLDPDDEYYFGKNAEVKFETFGPWQDFDDLRFEVVLTQYEYTGAETDLLNEDFESGFLPVGWSSYNVDGGGTQWTGFGGWGAVHGWALGEQDGWLITPAISLDGLTELWFWEYNEWPADYGKNSILISTGSSDPNSGDFVEIWSPDNVSASWVYTTVNLWDYAGQTVYIAFRYQGDNGHSWYLDDIGITGTPFTPRTFVDYFDMGNIPHVDGVNQYSTTFPLPSMAQLAAYGFDVDPDGTMFEVEVRAFIGEAGESFLLDKELITIDEFFALSGTEDEALPLTFDDLEDYRFAITHKLPLSSYTSQDVFLQFTYTADIKAPNFLSLPRLQVTMDNGITYTDLEVPGSVFEAQARLDAQALNMVYRYPIPDTYLTDETRFRWYQEVPDGEWTINNISISRVTNEVAVDDYLKYSRFIEVMEEVIPEFCDQFSVASLQGYDWGVEDVDPVSGFEAPAIAGEEFGFTWAYDPASLEDELPAETEYLFYIEKKASTFKKSSPDYQLKGPRGTFTTGFDAVSTAEVGSLTESKADEEGKWIGYHDGVPFGAIGAGTATYHMASRWLPVDIADYDGLEITKIRFPMGDVVSSGAVKIWQGADPDNLTQMIRQPFTQVEDTWLEIELENPYVIDASQELWFGVEWVGLADTYPMIRDEFTTYDGFGNMVKLGTDPWAALSGFGFAGDWIIEAFVAGAEGPVLINEDGLPVTLADAPFTGVLPETLETGIYQVSAVAMISDEAKLTICELGPVVVKEDLLVINNDNEPDEFHTLMLDGLYDEANPVVGFEIDSRVIGETFQANYTTYGPWPTDMNFAAVFNGNILGEGTDTGEGVVLDNLVMPVIPQVNEEVIATYYPANSPAQYDYNLNTYTELGWADINVAENGYVGNVNVSFNWLVDTWVGEAAFYLESPSGTVVAIASGAPTGSYSIDLDGFFGEEVNGNWKIYITDSFGDGGAQASSISVTFFEPTSVRIYTYLGDELVLGETEMELDFDDFMVYGYNEDDDQFDQEGNRWAVSPAIDISMLDPDNTSLVFDYTDFNVTQSIETLPVLQVSQDGGTTFSNVTTLMGSNQYRIDIGAFLGTNVVFKWLQVANFGEDFDEWTIDNILITSGEDNIYFFSNAIPLMQIIPQVDVDYLFEIQKDASDLEPAIYAGDEFEYSWDVVGNEYPAGTIFTIELHDNGEILIDNETGEPVILQDDDQVGVFTATAPIVDRGTYDVFVRATYGDIVYDEEYVAVINIFNPIIRTSIAGLDVPYAGGTANFVGTLETNPDITLNSTYWYNLILEDGADDWLLAAQQGSATFNNVALPIFYNGLLDFKIQATLGGALGIPGNIINYANDQVIVANHGMAAENNPGQRSLLTLDLMEDYDVNLSSGWEGIAFDVYFSEEMSQLTTAQYLVLEYSVDGGMNYTQIASYPDARFNDETYFDGDWFMERELMIPEGAKVEETILRFRIQQTKGDVVLRDIAFVSTGDVRNAPYFALVSPIAIAKQRVEITGFDATSYVACDNVDIEIFYNIRGSFGEDVVHTLFANGDDTGLTFPGITSGSGSLIINVEESWESVRFNFETEDRTFEDDMAIIIEVDGDLSDAISIEIVPEINEFTPVAAMNDYSCDVAERFVVITPQNYFVYRVRNAVTLDWLSDAVMFDPEDPTLLNEDGDFALSIGLVADRTIAEVVVTSQSMDGSLVCETLVIDNQLVFDVRNYALQYIWYNNEIGGIWTDMPADPADFVICYDSNDLEFRLWDYSMNNGQGGVINADIDWYRDNTNTPVGSTGWLSNFPITGEYFAVITSEVCADWTSQLVGVVVEDAPVKPVITFVGEQELCEGEHATLQIENIYNFYRWYLNGWLIEGSNTNSIDIYQGGFYEVEVSNYPFDPFVPVCTQFSDGLNVDLNIHMKPYMPGFTVVDNSLCEAMPAQIIISNWEDNVWYQPYIWETGEPTGTAKLGYENNIILETDVLQNEVSLGIMAWRMGVEQCGPFYSTETEMVMVYNLEILVSGNTLIATVAPYNTSQNPFGALSYQWFRNDILIMNNGDGPMLTIYDDAQYSVVVVTYDGCVLTASTAKIEPDPEVVAEGMSFNLYPNPVQNGDITLKLNGEYLGEMNLKVINLAGVVIYESIVDKSAIETEHSFNVESLTHGVYILQITGGEYSEVIRFIKK